jgi:hypothetical protein
MRHQRSGKEQPHQQSKRNQQPTPDNRETGDRTPTPLLELHHLLGNQKLQRLLLEGHLKQDTLQRDGDAKDAAWDYDPNKLLDATNVNPEFRAKAKAALQAAVGGGLRPVVHEAYRSPERSDELYQKWKKGKGGRAAPAWTSLHNYGLAMDVYLYDSKGKIIDNHVKGWYKEFKKLAGYTSANNLVWGEPIGDSDHFEYHPKWAGLAGGDILKSTQKWAMDTSKAGEEATQTSIDWMLYFWWAAGAGGQLPLTSSSAEAP